MDCDEKRRRHWSDWLANNSVFDTSKAFNDGWQYGYLTGRASRQPLIASLIDSLTARIEAKAELLRARAEKPGV